MRWLKGLVIGMAALIFVGLTVVIVELARRAGEAPGATAILNGRPTPPTAGSATTPLPGPPGTPPKGFGETRVALPPGAVVEETTAGDGRLVLRLGLPDGQAALLLIDARTGRRLGLVRLDGQPRP